MKRNTIFGAAALLVAGAAIGAGSVVTQSAMADSATTDPAANTVTVGQLGTDGDGFQCTFTGAEAEALMPTPADMTAAAAELPVEVTGSFTVDPSNPGPGVQIGEAVVGATGAVGVGEITPAEALPADMLPASGDVTQLREGTPDECAGLLKDLPKP